MTDKLQIIRLTSGETVIGKVVEETAEELTVNQPIIVFTQSGPEGNQQVAFAPLSPFSEVEDIPLLKTSIQFHVKAGEQLKKNYLAVTVVEEESKVIMPTPSKIILP